MPELEEYPSSLWSTKGIESTSPEIHDLFHEVGSEYVDATLEKRVLIDPTCPPSEITFRSHVLTGPAQRMRSPDYIASKRRRGAAKIQGLIRELENRASVPDFSVWTHGPLEEIRRLITVLSDAEEHSVEEHEGNSCEILRQLRDTFLNEGWERYRDKDVRLVATQILCKLANQTEVTGADTDGTMDKLLDFNLNPCVGLPLQSCENDKDQIPD